MINALSVDLEDGWAIFSRNWLGKIISPTEAVVRSTYQIMQILDTHNTKATFFVLGTVAEKYPNLIKELAANAHEIAVHGYSHKQLDLISPDEFRKDICQSKKLLEDIISAEVYGYRAPVFSITKSSKWAFDILAEEGYKYDSSIVPNGYKNYGWKGFDKDICRVNLANGRSIIEVPMTVLSLPILNRSFVTGGGFMRYLPYVMMKFAMRKIQKQRPVIVYLHPYEVDISPMPEQVSLEHLDSKKRRKIEHFLKISGHFKKTMQGKLEKLLTNFKFTTIINVINAKVIKSFDV
jgi:polysaccharide deacetylase family protein (PEP-CTERM system associated)